nr:unnamed protein product [Callosobruchus analis]
MRLSPSVNGYIIHSDISESAESPQSNNNCLQQALLNINCLQKISYQKNIFINEFFSTNRCTMRYYDVKNHNIFLL